MRRFLFFILYLTCAMDLLAQTVVTSKRVMAYPKFKPAVITLMDGKIITVPLANVFLKRSTLLYHSIGGKNLEAKTSNIKSVDFDDRHYIRIDSMLAWRVDTVGKNALYCVSKIDLDALKNSILNSRQMTNIELGNSLLNTTTLDVDPENFDYPIINVFYYLYNGKIMPVHEREISRRIPKSKLYDYKVAISLSTFSWIDTTSLLDLLRRISQ